jgi:hypothetical protein
MKLFYEILVAEVRIVAPALSAIHYFIFSPCCHVIVSHLVVLIITVTCNCPQKHAALSCRIWSLYLPISTEGVDPVQTNHTMLSLTNKVPELYFTCPLLRQSTTILDSVSQLLIRVIQLRRLTGRNGA